MTSRAAGAPTRRTTAPAGRAFRALCDATSPAAGRLGDVCAPGRNAEEEEEEEKAKKKKTTKKKKPCARPGCAFARPLSAPRVPHFKPSCRCDCAPATTTATNDDDDDDDNNNNTTTTNHNNNNNHPPPKNRFDDDPTPGPNATGKDCNHSDPNTFYDDEHYCLTHDYDNDPPSACVVVFTSVCVCVFCVCVLCVCVAFFARLAKVSAFLAVRFFSPLCSFFITRRSSAQD